MTDAEKREYALAVLACFFARNGQPERIISSLEWETLRVWIEHYPLRIVLRGMADCSRPGRTLSFYVLPVERAYKTWREAVGI